MLQTLKQVDAIGRRSCAVSASAGAWTYNNNIHTLLCFIGPLAVIHLLPHDAPGFYLCTTHVTCVETLSVPCPAWQSESCMPQPDGICRLMVLLEALIFESVFSICVRSPACLPRRLRRHDAHQSLQGSLAAAHTFSS